MSAIMSTATLIVGLISLASAYIVDPPTTAAADTIQDYSACTPPPKTTPAPTPTNGIATPKPIQTGMVSSCDEFYLVVKDDTYYNITEKYSITLDQFYAWNPAIRTTFPVSSSKTTLITTQKPQTSSYVIPPLCRFDLSKGQYIYNPSPTTTTKPTTTTTSNSIVTPTPIQSGIVSNCKKFYKVVSGDGC
ncbi:hypothetical protein GQ44DRAFT_763543 [Phaeosphaeriaceae sp. PMI808]|nr:hypothetical protein GQ44DRAFT_763543 [Phaeosphaeriaceae sp. PMI808]